MEFLELAKSRFSARSYENKEIEKEKMGKIMEVIKAAPTAKNNQPFIVYIIKKSEDLEKIDRITPCRFGANTVLMITYKKSEEWYNFDEPDFRSGVEDASIVATHIMLEATDLGLATCYINRFSRVEAKKEFNLPEDEVPVLLMDLGYSDASPSERHELTKDEAEIIKFL